MLIAFLLATEHELLAVSVMAGLMFNMVMEKTKQTFNRLYSCKANTKHCTQDIFT